MQKAATLRVLRTVRKFLAEQRIRITWRVRTVLFCGAAKLLRILNNDDDNHNNKIICLLASLLNSLLTIYEDSNNTSRYKMKNQEKSKARTKRREKALQLI